VGTYDFAGKLDEARVYNRTLSGQEIKSPYAAGGGLAEYWTFDDGVGGVAADSSAMAIPACSPMAQPRPRLRA